MIQTVNGVVRIQSFPTPFSNPSYLWGTRVSLTDITMLRKVVCGTVMMSLIKYLVLRT